MFFSFMFQLPVVIGLRCPDGQISVILYPELRSQSWVTGNFATRGNNLIPFTPHVSMPIFYLEL